MNLFDIFESNEQELDEDLRKWFKDKWVRFGPDGEIRGDCARGDDSEGKPKCLPQSKAQSLGKKGRASAAARKRREDPNPERSGKAINVATKKKSNEGVAEGLVGDVVVHNYTKIPIDLEPGQAQIAGWGPNDEPLYRVKGQDGKEVKTWSKRRMLTIAKEQGVAEGFPYDVDHMSGPVIRNADMTTDNVKTKDKAEWDRAVNSINARVFDDMSDFRTDRHGERVTGNSAVWAKWDNATQTGWFNAKGRPLKPWPVKEQGVAEGLNEMDKTQTPPGRDGDIDWTKKQIHLGPEHVIKAKDVAKHALKALDKTMKKRHADTPKKKGVAEQELDEACWKGYHKEGMKTMFGKKYPNCVKNTNEEQEQHSEKCPHCGGELVSEELINEKKDACYYKVKSRYKVWPSAYASGALVKCRKKGADSWGNKSEGVAEGSLNELSKDTLKSYAKKAVPDMQASQNKSKAEYSKAALAKDDETANKHYDAAKQAKDRTEKRMAGVAGAIKRFNKEGVAEGKDEKNAQLKQDYKTAMHWSENARSPQEREEYRRKALKIKNHLEKQYKQGVAEDQLDEKWSQKYKDSINCSNPKGFSQKAHCAGEKKNEDMAEGKEYYTVTGTDSVSLRRDFNMAKDRNGWYLREGATPKQKLEAFRAFGSPKLKEFNLAAFSGGTQTKGEDNVISPVGSQTRAQYKK